MARLDDDGARSSSVANGSGSATSGARENGSGSGATGHDGSGRGDGSGISGSMNRLADGLGNVLAEQTASRTGSSSLGVKTAGRNAEVVSRSSAFLAPCRAVVTFVFCRSGAPKGSGAYSEKRLFEVEAVEENTLQQVMGAFCSDCRWM